MSGLKRIIIHWTVGTYTPNEHEKQAYHFTVGFIPGGKGKAYVKSGKYTPEDNINCNDGRYAAHCGGGNTGSIGISVCGMAGYKSKTNCGPYPITQVQMELLYKTVAQLCKKYKIAITPDTVLTHYEFGRKHPNTTSATKIDITVLPFNPKLKEAEIGNEIRKKILWYSTKI